MPIPDDEVEITTFKSRGPGGQKKNVTESAVRVRHRPTGLVVTATESRSQHRNRRNALEELERRLDRMRRPRKKRVPTRPARGARVRRLEEKSRQSAKKSMRKPPKSTED